MTVSQLYCLWDPFTAGVALSMMRNSQNHNEENEFAEMEYMNITVVTSNEPYGISDGSNPLTDGHVIPMLNVQKNGLHTGHIQRGMRDPFCLKNGKGGCQVLCYNISYIDLISILCNLRGRI